MNFGIVTDHGKSSKTNTKKAIKARLSVLK